jgi:hypothetical protein
VPFRWFIGTCGGQTKWGESEEGTATFSHQKHILEKQRISGFQVWFQKQFAFN